MDLTGRRFGRYTVVRRVENSAAGATRWLCLCDCGTERTVQMGNLRAGKAKSCGCLHRDMMRAQTGEANPNYLHGHNKRSGPSATYISWMGMKSRCDRASDPYFADYGARGIRYCSTWQDFAAFLADMGERPAGLTLDRIDNDGNYERGNCRWANSKEQAANRRANRGWRKNRTVWSG